MGVRRHGTGGEAFFLHALGCLALMGIIYTYKAMDLVICLAYREVRKRSPRAQQVILSISAILGLTVFGVTLFAAMSVLFPAPRVPGPEPEGTGLLPPAVARQPSAQEEFPVTVRVDDPGFKAWPDPPLSPTLIPSPPVEVPASPPPSGGGYSSRRSGSGRSGSGACHGSEFCSACTDCSRCRHCKSGGTCGVCAPKAPPAPVLAVPPAIPAAPAGDPDGEGERQRAPARAVEEGQRARAHAEEGRLADQQAAERNRKRAETLLGMGRGLEQAEKWDAAIGYYRQLVKEYPDTRPGAVAVGRLKALGGK